MIRDESKNTNGEDSIRGNLHCGRAWNMLFLLGIFNCTKERRDFLVVKIPQRTVDQGGGNVWLQAYKVTSFIRLPAVWKEGTVNVRSALNYGRQKVSFCTWSDPLFSDTHASIFINSDVYGREVLRWLWPTTMEMLLHLVRFLKGTSVYGMFLTIAKDSQVFVEA